MNISKMLNIRSNTPCEEWILIRELRFMLMYHLHYDLATINSLIETSLEENKGVNLKNYWLQKKEKKEQSKAHNAKLDEIARFVTKYINSKKSSKR